jgi:hypothetical protein
MPPLFMVHRAEQYNRYLEKGQENSLEPHLELYPRELHTIVLSNPFLSLESDITHTLLVSEIIITY